jgi:hypothetical protein
MTASSLTSARKSLVTWRIVMPATLMTAVSEPGGHGVAPAPTRAYISASVRSVRHTWKRPTRSGGTSAKSCCAA